MSTSPLGQVNEALVPTTAGPSRMTLMESRSFIIGWAHLAVKINHYFLLLRILINGLKYLLNFIVTYVVVLFCPQEEVMLIL